jgi:HPt (histidine-containing phosphotransfer) domain-containing protein
MAALDMSVVKEIKELGGEDDPGFLGSLIQIYLDISPEKIKKLKQAFARADATTVTQEAHSLKSSSANMGAVHLSSLLALLEEQAKLGKISAEMAEIFKEVEKEYLQVEEELKTLL